MKCPDGGVWSIRVALSSMQIPTQAGHLFQLDRGHRSDLKPATIPI
jgi:hypothetical protein